MSENLDADELFALAVRASDQQDSAQAISLFKRALEARPDFAAAHYLLGAEHAQLGMFDRAAEEMARAVACQPDLHAARFQLGMLQLTSGQPGGARQTWDGLSQLGQDHYFVQFRDGLLQLAQDDFEGCRRSLTAGIKGNTENVPLNHDMERILSRLPDAGGSNNDGSESEQGEGHLLVNAYTGYQRH